MEGKNRSTCSKDILPLRFPSHNLNRADIIISCHDQDLFCGLLWDERLPRV